MSGVACSLTHCLFDSLSFLLDKSMSTYVSVYVDKRYLLPQGHRVCRSQRVFLHCDFFHLLHGFVLCFNNSVQYIILCHVPFSDYFDFGFIFLQYRIDMGIVEWLNPSVNTSKFNIMTRRFPHPPYETRKKGCISVFYIYVFIYLSSNETSNMTDDLFQTILR